jgi:ribosomal protein S18 acetylase RimI-like enzyme
MQQITIREATPADLPTLLRFEQGVITAERPFDPTLKKEETHYYDLHQMITASHIELLVAEIDGKLVGSGYARIENAKPYLQHTHHAYLGFMYVEPEYRGHGINKAIIDALEDWAISQGITETRLDVYNENAPAIKAYEKAGFIKHLVNMRKG